MDEHIKDKLILLMARQFEFPMDTSDPQLRDKFWKQLMSELPAFMHYLLHEYEFPGKQMVESEAQAKEFQRYGIVSYANPVLLENLEELSPERQLLQIIDGVIWDGVMLGEETFSPAALHSRLANSEFAHDVRKLLSWSGAATTYLLRLSEKYPDRVKKTRDNTYTIYKPSTELPGFDYEDEDMF